MSDGSGLSNVTRRGNISQRVQCLSSSGIRRFFDILDGMKDVISLGVGQPDFVTPAIIRNAAIKSIEDGQTHYTSNYGIIELRQAISRHLQHHYDVFYEPTTEIIVTTGVSEGLNITMQTLLDIGDEVLCPDPHFVAYPACVALADGVFVPVPTSDANAFKVTAAALEERITPRTKAILLGYPSNPTGAVMEREDLLAVAEIAEKHNLFVVSDEIYDRLVYGMKHTCFASLPG
ncbi:MAG TPA: aminotransferase class I/II-fold pyridoxal phosphate-dependent enzyme, partial [Coriobacteriia bacterium]